MAPVLNDIVRVVNVFERQGSLDIFTNTFYFKVLAASWASDLQFMSEIANYMDISYLIINGSFNTAMLYKHIDGQNITQNQLLPLVPWPTLTAGVNATDMLPTQCTARPYFPTNRPKTRAAIGLPPYSENTQSGGGLIAAATLTVTETWADRFVGNMILAGGTLQYGAFNNALVRFTPVDSRVVPQRFRTIKRRRVGVGA